MKRTLLFFVVILLMASLACSIGGVSAPEISDETAAQARSVSATAQAAAQEAGNVAATAAAVAEAQREVALATAQAVNPQALELALDDLQFDINALRERFESVQLGEDGQATIIISEADVNQAIQTRLDEIEAANNLESAQVAFEDGAVVFSGELSSPVSGTLVVSFLPSVEDGALTFEVLSASFGNIQVPAQLLGTAAATINQTIGAAVNTLPSNVQLQSVAVGADAMTIVVARR